MIINYKGNKVPLSINYESDRVTFKFPYNKDFKDFIKKCGASFNMGNKTWQLPNDIRTQYIIAFILKKHREITQKYFEGYENYNGSVEGIPLWEHQKINLDFIMSCKQCMIAGETRTGKTRPSILAAKYYGDKFIFVTKKSAMYGIKQEINRIKPKGNCILLTYEKFRRYIEQGLEPCKFIILDESHMLKDPNSLRSKRIKEYAWECLEYYNRENYLIAMSGTPGPKNAFDFWNQIETISPGWFKYSFLNFKKEIANMELQEGMAGQYYWEFLDYKEGNLKRLHDIISPITKVNFLKDMNDVPEVRTYILKIKPTSYQVSLKKKIQNRNLKGVEENRKILEVSSGFYYVPEYDEESGKTTNNIEYFDTGKDSMLINQLDEFEQKGRVVIYTHNKATVQKVSKLCVSMGWSVLEHSGKGTFAKGTQHEPDFLEEQMDGSVEQVIEKLAVVANPDVVEGKEFSASDVIIYYSNSYNGTGKKQSSTRCSSANNKHKHVVIYEYVCFDEDRKVIENLLKKQQTEYEVLSGEEEIL